MDLDALENEAAKKLGCDVRDIEMYSWPEVFPSSSGPNLRPGGQSMTTFQVFAFAHPGESKAIKYCSGVWKPWDRLIASAW